MWQDATRGNAPFLATAAQLNSEVLTPVFRWIVDNIVVFQPAAMPMEDFSVSPDGANRSGRPGHEVPAAH